MRTIPDWMWDVWESGQFVGPNKPNTRATISKAVLKEDGEFRTLLFNQDAIDYEIPNIASVNIDRSLSSDAAQLNMKIRNQGGIDAQANLDEAYDGGSSPTRRSLKDLGTPGYYTFRRGLAIDGSGLNPWGHDANTWVDMFIPNRLIKVYQGYGTDGSGTPSADTRLVLTGIFLIDQVTYTAEGDIDIVGRDPAKLLLEQRLYPPIVPLEPYPLKFCADRYETTTETVYYDYVTVRGETSDNFATHSPEQYDSSVAPYYGYNASIYGHRASDAFDGNEDTYWLSVGYNEANASWSLAWLGASAGGNWINRIRFKPLRGGYKGYLAIKSNGAWVGSKIIPFSNWPVYDNFGDVPYIQEFNVPQGEEWVTLELDYSYQVTEFRLAFSNLQYDGRGTYPYRAGVYEVQAYNEFMGGEDNIVDITQEVGTRDVEEFIPGNISDYTDIVKIFAAWAGFYWPYGTTDNALTRWQESNTTSDSDVSGSLGGLGRVWGDFFYSGAYPVEPPCIDPSFWDNKSVMDGINQIKEILGFVCFVDPYGGLIWRPPNIWKTGNFVIGQGYVGEDSVREIDETNVLVNYGVQIDDRNLRSDIIVVSAEDPSVYGAYQPGFAIGEVSPSATDTSDLSLLGGQQRIMLVPNYPFGAGDSEQARQEVEKFAFLTSLWIHWSYRKSKFRIPGNPAFMPDDQVRIYERTTSETYIHYLQGVRSSMDLDRGTWYLDVDTHWLGNGPDEEWVIRSQDMHPALFRYLQQIGQIPDAVNDDTTLFPPGYFDVPVVEVPDDIPRLDTDLESLFPDPPTLVYPVASWDSESEDAGTYITEPTNGSGGSAFNCSNAAKFANWGPGPSTPRPTGTWSCETSNLGYYTFLKAWEGFTAWNTFSTQTDTVKLRIDRRAWPAFRRLIEIIVEEQYPLKADQCSSYSCRPVKKLDGSYSTTTWSNHAWGLAVDLNSIDNAYGTRAISGSTIYKIGTRAESEIRGSAGEKIIRWGNWFSKNPDPMHFEVCCHPSVLEAGVVIE